MAVRMMKKARKNPPMESSPPAPAIFQDSRARFKYQSLLQDYEELLKETEAKKEKLLSTKQKKTRLLAEVRFLRRKHKSFSENPAQETRFRIKKQPRRSAAPAVSIRHAHLSVATEGATKEKNLILREAAKPSTSFLLDLNQISAPQSCEEMEGYPVEVEPHQIGKAKKFLMNGEGSSASSDKISSCRENTSNRLGGKRKISWQDQVALRV